MLTSQWFTASVNTEVSGQQQIWVAYSGGVDSHVLLDLARRSFPNVRAIHINHGLSVLDDQWQQHCEIVCDQLKLPLQCIRVDAVSKPGQSQENVSRLARRNAWRNLLQANDVLLLAHHADDQAETVLYRLMRGAGPKGLSGIKVRSKLGAATLVRPLLGITKQQILEYSQLNNLNWLQDETNSNTSFDRNYIRNVMLPVMLQRWPAAVSNINRAAALSGSITGLVTQTASEKIQNILLQDNILDIARLSQEPQGWQHEILRNWLEKFDITPSLQQLELIFAEVINARIDAQPEYVIADRRLKRSNNKLYLLANNLTAISTHGRKAKKIFQQYGIPPWERANYPLVFDGDKLVAIVGLWQKN